MKAQDCVIFLFTFAAYRSDLKPVTYSPDSFYILGLR